MATIDLADLAYNEAARSLEHQLAAATELRGRAGALVATAAISVSLLGPRALDGAQPFGWLALGAFVLRTRCVSCVSPLRSASGSVFLPCRCCRPSRQSESRRRVDRMALTQQQLMEALYNPKTPSSTTSLYTGKLIREMKPSRLLRRRLPDVIRRDQGRPDAKPDPGPTA
jgi:hypothetical protein